MFNAEKYFRRALKALDTDRCISKVEQGEFIVQKNWQDWTIIRFKTDISFHSGHTLAVFEVYERDSAGRLSRRINYHLRTAENEPIFCIDNHRNEYPYRRPYHVHIGREKNEIENGNGRLCGYDLEKVDFLKALWLAHRHIKGKKLPWE